MIAKRISTLEYAIRDVVLPARELEKGGHKILKLNIGDPGGYDFDAPGYAKDAYIKAIREGKNYYADSGGTPEARREIAKREKRLNDLDVDEERVIVGDGVSPLIQYVFGALIEKGDEALVPSPSYPLYLSFPKYFGGKSIEYKCDEGNGWNPDLEDIKEKITPKTKIISVINPNNPTGAVYSKETLKGIVDLAVDNELTITSDEIYDELTFEKYTCLTRIAVDAGASVVQMNGMSKNFFATGWRIGYGIFYNSDELYNACAAEARNHLCAPTPAQFAMAEVLNGPRDFLEENKRKIMKRANYCYERCNEIGLPCVKPKGAFYAFPKIGDGNIDDKKWVLDLLKEKYVLTVFGSGFGEYGRGHFRIVTLPPEGVLEEAFSRIEDFMKTRK
ncbi:MAG: aminotransferase class I/II-fold pyridoxal phosphate-dependent enzyme [Candidatus Diapherotrites archaeon]|nr:aminotransferase class I/II-fold pyridoxal phosphate-dependent enzyme [Candidatus Diapherotrites archaeon]